MVPGRVREEEIDPRRLLAQQRLVHIDRIVLDVDRAQDAAVDGPVRRCAEQFQRAQDMVVRAAAVGEPPVPVVGEPIAVQRDPDFDVLIREELADGWGEPDPVGLQVQVEFCHRIDHRSQLRQDPAENRAADQQRLPTVQDHRNAIQAVAGSVLGDPDGSGADRGLIHHRGAAEPTPVGIAVDVTVIAGQVAPAGNLEHVLGDRSHRDPGHRDRGGHDSDARVEGDALVNAPVAVGHQDPRHLVVPFVAGTRVNPAQRQREESLQDTLLGSQRTSSGSIHVTPSMPSDYEPWPKYRDDCARCHRAGRRKIARMIHTYTGTLL
jgi:hypothetical protein